MKIISLTENQKQTLSNYADSEKPNESCAILFGNEKNKTFRVEKIFLTENIEKSPIRFTISAEQILEADKIERESSLKMIGIFHSHPNSEAFPSETDKKFMEINPVIWVIYSGISKNFKAFLLESGIQEVHVAIE